MLFIDFLCISTFFIIIFIKLVTPNQNLNLIMKNLKRIVLLIALVVVVTKVLF